MSAMSLFAMDRQKQINLSDICQTFSCGNRNLPCETRIYGTVAGKFVFGGSEMSGQLCGFSIRNNFESPILYRQDKDDIEKLM